MSNAAGGAGAGAAQRRRSSSKRKSREAELDADTDTKTKDHGDDKNHTDGATDDGMDVDAAAAVTRRDPRAPEKDNTIVRRLKGGRAGVPKAKVKAASGGGGSSVKTRKMTAAAAATAAASKSEAHKSVPAPASAPALAPAPVAMTEQAVEVAPVRGAAGRLLAAARGGAGGAGRSTTIGPRRVPIDSAEAATSSQARRVS